MVYDNGCESHAVTLLFGTLNHMHPFDVAFDTCAFSVRGCCIAVFLTLTWFVSMVVSHTRSHFFFGHSTTCTLLMFKDPQDEKAQKKKEESQRVKRKRAHKNCHGAAVKRAS